MFHTAIMCEYKVSQPILLLSNQKIKNYLFARKPRLWKNQGILYENLLGIPLIDAEGYRANVGIVIINDRGQVFWARRFGQHSWQYPQGGVDEGETAEETMYRELHEEVGLKPEHVKIVASTKHWLRYKLPKRLIRHESKPVCIGQKQKWFLLKLTAQESAVDLLNSDHPEFDDWRWVSYWYPVRQVVSFKREVYRKVMKEFAQASMPSYRPNHRKRRG